MLASMQMQRTKSLCYYGLLFTLASFCLGPIVLMVTTSLKVKSEIFADKFTWLFIPTLSNYGDVFLDDKLSRYFWNSCIIGSISTAMTLMVGCMAAYALVRFRFMGRDAVSIGTLLMRMVPPAVLTVPVFMIWTYNFGISNTLSGVILSYVALNLPFAIWILQSFIEQVPPQLEEAARMDGANPLQIFLLVVLPVIRPGLAAAAIFTFRIAWNEFILALVLTNRFTRTLPVKVSLFITEHNIEWGQIMAIGTLIAIPPLVVTFLASRQIITGLTAGAVKG